MISDANDCNITVDIPIGNDNGPELNTSITNVNCFGECNGSASVSVLSGQGPYRFSWSNGDTTFSTSGLCAGNYFVQVTDGNNCVTIEQINITEPDEIAIDFNLKDETCEGQCDGEAYASVSGGVPSYQFSWSAGGNLNAINGLCAGVNTLTVTDTNNCSVTQEFEILSSPPMELTFVRRNVSCESNCDGEVEVQITGGNGPYQISWSNNVTTAINANLCIGSYAVQVTDNNGCMVSDTVQIGNIAPPIAANINITDATCGLCDGIAVVNPTGGNGAPYTYRWSSPQYTGNNVTNLCAGIHQVTIIDNQGCSKDFQVLINNNGGPTLTDSIEYVACNGDCDGRAIITPTGVKPFTYFWTDSLRQTSDTASNLCAGNYAVLVTDSNGCITTRAIEITAPEPLDVGIMINPLNCPGDSLGAAFTNVTGGTAPYDYLWSTGANDTLSFIDSLFAGSYNVTVTDSLGCTSSDTAVIDDPTPLNLTMSKIDALCFSACDGIAEVQITGGAAPYNISWNDPNGQSGSRAIGLCSGKYIVTVVDNNGCSALDSITLVEPASIALLSVVPSNPDCVNGNNGSIDITPTGGLPPYSYLWGDGQKTNPAVGLSAGQHTVIVIDDNGCTYYDTFTLNNPSALTATFATTPAQCDSANGSIQVTPMGGSGNYAYSWNSIPTQTSAIATDLLAGIYELDLTDNISGCEAQFTVILDNVNAPPITVNSIDETCFGACNGSANVVATAIVDYTWNDPGLQKTATATNLCAGNYTITVTDTGGCKASDTVTINTTTINVQTVSINNTSCFGLCDGSATVIASGGLDPYDYSWNTMPVQNGNTANSLCEGSYLITATDSNGCFTNSTVNITSPQELSVEAILLTGNGCNSSCDGIAEARVTGGTGPYNYLWDNNSTANNVSGLCSGIHWVRVTDANGCSMSDTIEIIPSSAIIANAIVTRPICGEYNGSITLQVTGGTGPYLFSWSNGENTGAISGLFAGIYTVVITDSEGCSSSNTYFLNNPNAPNLNFANNTVNCEGDCNGIAVVNPVGGVMPYQYAWDYVPASFTDSLKELCSGVYSVKVTDGVGCIAFGNDTVREPERLTATPTVDDPGCGGACAGEASANPAGGTPPYRFSWNTTPVVTTNVATNLCAGDYDITITDTNNCVTVESISINPPPPLVIDSTPTIPATCNDEPDGEAAIYITGGIPPYSYFWNDGSLTQIVPGQRRGTKIVQVTDANNCQIQDTIEVGVIDLVSVTALDDFAACFDQEIDLTAVGSGVVSYQWFLETPTAITQVGNDSNIRVILADTSMYVIRGSNNSSPECVDRDTVIVTGIPAPNVDAGPDETILRGESTILDNVTPFFAQGFYDWTPGTGLDDSTVIRPRANPTETTQYIITITDEFGCFNSDTITVFVSDKEIVYNGITPNGDGVNDVWTIELIEEYPDAIVEIYNRWGTRIFRSEGYTKKWDGTYNGDPLPSGTYYYVIDLQAEGTKPLTGPITLLK